MSETAEPIIASTRPDVFADHDPEVKVRTKKMMMWFIIFAIIMVFAGLTSGMIVLYGQILRVNLTPPSILWISNGVVIASSITYYLALRTLKNGNTRAASLLTLLTLALGIAFCFTQNAGWDALSDKGMGYTIVQDESGAKAYRWNALGKMRGEYGVDYRLVLNNEVLIREGNEYYLPSDAARTKPVTDRVLSTFNATGAMMSILIYLHIFHLALGLIYLVVNLVRQFKGVIHPGNTISLYTGGMYWHFMGILWLYLFFFLFFIY